MRTTYHGNFPAYAFTCRTGTCDRAAFARGLCQRCYQRQWGRGRPPQPRRPLYGPPRPRALMPLHETTQTSWNGWGVTRARREMFALKGTECTLRLPGCTGTATTVDHTLPRLYHPEAMWLVCNMRPACLSCNVSKGSVCPCPEHRDLPDVCREGHPYTPDNTRWITRRGGDVRRCRTCAKANKARARARAREWRDEQ